MCLDPRSLRVVIPPADKPEKWDAADAVQDGLNIQVFLNSVPQSKIQLQRYEAFSLTELIADKSPMPDDLIAPRLLTGRDYPRSPHQENQQGHVQR